MNSATLVLENGLILQGDGFGAREDSVFELVFNTSMTGYQEILTDPSYREQGVLFTTPHIGNVGINLDDNEALVPQISALIVRSISPGISNWRASCSLPDWLSKYNIPGISGIDTRMLTRILRDHGTMKAALSTKDTPAEILYDRTQRWPGLDGKNLVKFVTCSKPQFWSPDSASEWVVKEVASHTPDPGYKKRLIVLYDFGSKRNISRHLAARGAKVLIVPAEMPVEEVTHYHPDGYVLSNGPGDPAGLHWVIHNVKNIIALDKPVFGICLGHQLLGLALGCKTSRLKFGHHGGNHPVIEVDSRKTIVTSQNHNYAVDIDSLDLNQVKISHVSLNDHTLEGMRFINKPIFSVQFHPEASPGPHDAFTLFDDFFDLMG
jgi:carbamoyl-phosphate synthase small subunit